MVNVISNREWFFVPKLSETREENWVTKNDLEGFSKLKIYLEWNLIANYDFEPKIIDNTYHDFIDKLSIRVYIVLIR